MRLVASRRFSAHLFHCSILTCSAARVRRLGSFFQIAFLRVIFFPVNMLRLPGQPSMREIIPEEFLYVKGHPAFFLTQGIQPFGREIRLNG
jgi:hypothetical protein